MLCVLHVDNIYIYMLHGVVIMKDYVIVGVWRSQHLRQYSHTTCIQTFS